MSTCGLGGRVRTGDLDTRRRRHRFAPERAVLLEEDRRRRDRARSHDAQALLGGVEAGGTEHGFC